MSCVGRGEGAFCSFLLKSLDRKHRFILANFIYRQDSKLYVSTGYGHV